MQHKPEEVKHEEPKKEEPKIQAPKPETPKKEEPKKEEKPVEVKKEVIVEAPKPTETHAENVEYLAPPQKQASSPEKAQVQASPEKQDKSPEKKNDPIVVSTPPKEVKTNSPLNLDGSIGKNYEIVTKPEEDGKKTRGLFILRCFK